MLGQHFIGHHHAVGIELAQGNDALPFAEQVRENAAVSDGHRLAEVGDDKTHVQRVARALQRALLDHATGTDAGIEGRFAIGNLGRGVEQVDVLLQRAQGQAHGDADPGQQAQDDEKTFLSQRIHLLFSRRRRRASSCR
ncbi:hypothetical protein D3C76_380610 [compost metagenome]